MKSTMKENLVIQEALQILENRLRRYPYTSFVGVQDTKDFLTLKLAEKQHEVFSALFLDNRHRLIQFSEIFKGSIDCCSIYTREVVRLSLKHKAAAVIFAHNHPSGVAEPSQSDIKITSKLKNSLELIDVRVLDHYVIGGTDPVSFAERGFLGSSHPILVMECMNTYLGMENEHPVWVFFMGLVSAFEKEKTFLNVMVLIKKRLL